MLPYFHPDGEHLFYVAPPDVIYATPGHAFAVEDRTLAQRHGSRKLYELHAWVVMPNHVHMLILLHVPLPQTTHWIKRRTAREANLLLERNGRTALAA